MSVTHPAGLSLQVNRVILSATVVFGGCAFAGLAFFGPAARPGHGVGASLVYGLCLVACALCSFLYNIGEPAARRALLRYLDHAAIFLLIAGTYTPFAAAGIRGPDGGSLLGWVWGLALSGMLLKLVLPRSFDRLFVGAYLAIGWLFLAALDEILHKIPLPCLSLLALGGIAYTVGALIYAWDIGRWTDPVWHGFVLAGIVAHFIAIVAFLVASPMA